MDNEKSLLKKEKVWNQDLWKPIGVEPVEVKDYPGAHNGQLHSFLDYQAPDDRYEVRGIMPKAPKSPIKYKQLIKKI